VNSIPEFNDAEKWVIESALKERYKKKISIELADSEVKLDANADQATLCPAICWAARAANFAICKIGENRYRSMFFYSVYDAYGTGREEYDDIAECVSILLRLQADHEKERAGASSGKTKDDLSQSGAATEFDVTLPIPGSNE